MNKRKEFYNPELGTIENYDEVWKLEVIKVKDESDLVVMNHYWQDKDGELWGDFNNPMENVKRGFDAYRKRKGYMTPDEIRNLRNQLNMSVKEFAYFVDKTNADSLVKELGFGEVVDLNKEGKTDD